MDLYGNLWAINHSPSRVRARAATRARRQRSIYDHIGPAIGNTHAVEAALRWNQQPQMRNESDTAIGSQHPGLAAVIAVRAALSEFQIPTDVQTRFAGMQRFSGEGSYKMRDGVVVVEATLRSLSGISRVVDIPVQVHEGRILEPGVLIDRGVVRAMTQHAFDDLLEQGTFDATIPDRMNMYSPPPDQPVAQRRAPLVRPGLFGVAPTNRMLTRAYVQSALTGHYAANMPSFDEARHVYGQQSWGEAPDHRDRAEMPRHPIQAGDSVRLSRDVTIVGRDGFRLHLSQETEGRVQRDMEGDGRYFYVFFPEAGYTARVPGAYLEK